MVNEMSFATLFFNAPIKDLQNLLRTRNPKFCKMRCQYTQVLANL